MFEYLSVIVSYWCNFNWNKFSLCGVPLFLEQPIKTVVTVSRNIRRNRKISEKKKKSFPVVLLNYYTQTSLNNWTFIQVNTTSHQSNNTQCIWFSRLIRFSVTEFLVDCAPKNSAQQNEILIKKREIRTKTERNRAKIKLVCISLVESECDAEKIAKRRK